MSRHSTIAAVALLLACAIPLREAAAQSSDACLTVPVEGQHLRNAGQLVAARGQFEACARNTCPAEIVKDCSRWLGEVQAAIPSVVLAARDEAGRDLVDVIVSVDGKPAKPVGALAMELDPGAHEFVFSRAGAPGVEQRVLLREGEKNREVLATFRAPSAPAAALSAAPTPPARYATTTTRPVPVLTWVLGGVGVAAVAAFGTAGVLGVTERSADHCDTGCAQAQKDSVDTKLRIADVSLGIGVAALVAAGIVYLVRPSVERP